MSSLATHSPFSIEALAPISDKLVLQDLQFEINHLNAKYAQTLNDNNFGQGMMKDRIYGVTQTIFHAPYYTRHLVGQVLILGTQSTSDHATLIVTSSNYSVFRTKPGQTSEVFNVGQYVDHWTRTHEGLKLASRHCIYDSEMVLNSLIYPI